jgi:hypothetical protein
VTYLLHARTVGTKKQPLLANGSETTFYSRKRLGNHVPAATDTHATIEVLLEKVFFTRSVQRGYKEDNWGNRVRSVWESVKKGDIWKAAAIQWGLDRGSWRTSTVRSRYLGTAGEDNTAGWKRQRVLWWSVKCGISDGAVITCMSGQLIYSPVQTPPIVTNTRDNDFNLR